MEPCNASICDAVAGWPQADLHDMVPWMLNALAIASAQSRSSRPDLAARLDAAALQLLPPVLDGLHARMLGLLDRERSTGVDRLLSKQFLDALVRPGTACTGAPVRFRWGLGQRRRPCHACALCRADTMQ